MSLWGEDFEVNSKKKEKKILEKIARPKKVVTEKVIQQKSKKDKIVDPYSRIPHIQSEVDRILGKYKDNTLVIRDLPLFRNYISVAIKNGSIAVDTETNNSLDPITCKLMGLCIYTPDMKQAYIPVNHVDKNNNLLSDQITENQIQEELSRLISNHTKVIMHNGKFDYQVIKCTCNIELVPYWDTMIAAKILNENELRASLKEQYVDKIDSNQEKYDIENLFEGVQYSILDPDLFALYAATDSKMTYELYLWQLKQFALPDNRKLAELLFNVEMPVVQVAAEMELTGICIDEEYSQRLSKKYHDICDKVDQQIEEELKKFEDQISKWRLTPEANFHPISKKPNKNGEYLPQKSKSEQLQNPIQITSPTQLAILLYDVLNVGVIDQKTPRGTGEEILQKINLPLCNLILEKRGLEKLIGTYIDKLPKCLSEKDNRLHAHFNQLGAGTGRFSSSDPNLQNIPSKNKEIRLMFKASDGYTLVGADYSQQEPRLLCQYSQDENMTNAYMQGKDLYATIASGVYKNDYWDNMEHREDGTANPEGKKRRSNCKSLLLGIMYGRGANSIAEQIGTDLAGAQKIIDDFYNGFPKVKEWTDKTEADAKINGYVEDLWGRRRRLPDIQLPKYTIKVENNMSDFNPLLGSLGKYSSGNSQIIEEYKKKLDSVKSRKDYNLIKAEAEKNQVRIIDNGGFIAQAQRQCVNARIQGGAASMSKLAMRRVFDSKELKNLGFRILLQIHDELIGECPIENADKVADVLTSVMKEAAKPAVQVPFKCDATIETHWYETDYSDSIINNYNNLLKSKSSEQSFTELLNDHKELTEDQLRKILKIVD